MLDQIIEARDAKIGADMAVRRVLPYVRRRMVGPFTFLDHAGPRHLAAPIPITLDVLPHPHIGLSTLTYLFDGAWTHRDSLGVHQVIRPGDVNWMTAGRGVTHSERFEDTYRRTGGPMELLQAWVALPEHAEETAPTFHHHSRDTIPTFDEPGVVARLVAGTAWGRTSPVEVHSPLVYLHADLDDRARLQLPDDHPERAVYVVRGTVRADGREHGPGRMLVVARGTAVVEASGPATVVVLGGEPLGPRHIWWNFVSSRKDRIEQAKEDWRAGRFALPVDDDQEWVPLPGEPAPPAQPMS